MALLDGKVAVITGAGSGMAKASTKVFVVKAHASSPPTSAGRRRTPPSRSVRRCCPSTAT